MRVGIGGGSICSTRIVTGHGVPTLQSILDCSKTTYETKIIADGGIKTSGDMVKALAAGADFVMVGSMLAGTRESPGETLRDNAGKRYKVYRGMASSAAMSNRPDKNKGSVSRVIQNIDGGIRSGMSYTGATTLEQFRSKCDFIVQTQAGQSESNTHILWRNK